MRTIDERFFINKEDQSAWTGTEILNFFDIESIESALIDMDMDIEKDYPNGLDELLDFIGQASRFGALQHFDFKETT